MEDVLSAPVSAAGANLSVGQRHLICLVHAQLKNNKILVLDEATTNVDLETDEIIQNTIKKNFADCTVLTIAHRLNTVIDADKILVMDDGEVSEYDRPYILLNNPDTGLFSSTVDQTGPAVVSLLRTLAEESYYKFPGLFLRNEKLKLSDDG